MAARSPSRTDNESPVTYGTETPHSPTVESINSDPIE